MSLVNTLKSVICVILGKLLWYERNKPLQDVLLYEVMWPDLKKFPEVDYFPVTAHTVMFN